MAKQNLVQLQAAELPELAPAPRTEAFSEKLKILELALHRGNLVVEVPAGKDPLNFRAEFYYIQRIQKREFARDIAVSISISPDRKKLRMKRRVNNFSSPRAILQRALSLREADFATIAAQQIRALRARQASGDAPATAAESTESTENVNPFF